MKVSDASKGWTRMRSRLLKITTAVVITAILALALYPTVIDPLGMGNTANHVVAFMTIAFLARLAWPRLRVSALALSIVGFGGLIEVLQWASDIGRQAQIGDWLADLLATLIGLLLGSALLSRERRKTP